MKSSAQEPMCPCASTAALGSPLLGPFGVTWISMHLLWTSVRCLRMTQMSSNMIRFSFLLICILIHSESERDWHIILKHLQSFERVSPIMLFDDFFYFMFVEGYPSISDHSSAVHQIRNLLCIHFSLAEFEPHCHSCWINDFSTLIPDTYFALNFFLLQRNRETDTLLWSSRI